MSRKFRGTQYVVKTLSSIVKITAKFVDTFTDQAAVGYVYGDSTCGQRALYPLGMTGIPVYNVNNNCATGSSALFLAKQLVAGGIADCVMALGFEKMQKGTIDNSDNIFLVSPTHYLLNRELVLCVL